MSLAMHLALRERAHSCDIMHNHSLWVMPNLSAGLVARGATAGWSRRLAEHSLSGR